jgi:hypothetical protein
MYILPELTVIFSIVSELIYLIVYIIYTNSTFQIADFIAKTPRLPVQGIYGALRNRYSTTYGV